MEKLSNNTEKNLISDRNWAIFIRFNYPAPFPEKINFEFNRDMNGRPNWMNNRPDKIDDYLIGVAHYGILDIFCVTFKKSYEAAAIAMLSWISTSWGPYQDRFTSRNYRRSEGFMQEIVVPETWRDQDRPVYTLAITNRLCYQGGL